MSKLSATLSIVIALIVGALVTYLAGHGGPPTNDGNPVGFHLTGTVTPVSGTPSVAAFQNCVSKKSCTVTVDFQLPKSAAAAPTPSTCPAGSTCLQFVGTTHVNSVDYQNHPVPSGQPAETVNNSSGTLSIGASRSE